MSGNTCLKLLTILSAAAGTILMTCATALSAPIDGKLKKAIDVAFEDVLNDPYSAKFTYDRLVERGAGVGVVCGTVNAKNKMGAYVGKRVFTAVYVKDTAGTFHADPKVWDEGVSMSDISVCGNGK